MGATAALRLVAGVVTFAVVARLLGPESFGVLMFWVSVTALITIITNYGLTPYVLREMGAHPESAESIINEGLTGKILLAVLVLIFSVAATFIFDLNHKQVFYSLLIAALADCFTEFLNAGFRARNRFDIETKIATINAVTHGTIVCGSVFLSPTIQTAAGAYAASRLLVLFITVPEVARHFAAPQLAAINAALARLRKAISYAIDFGFQSLFGQVDSVVLNAFIGPAAVGLHQAGMRVFLGGAQVAPILANVFLPRAATSANSKAEFSQECRRIQFAFLAFGALFGLSLAALAQPLVSILFGNKYQQLVSLMPFFGLLFYLRFASGAWGLVLTAAGKQTFRTQISIIQWGIIFFVGWLTVPLFGNRGWLVALCAGSVIQGLIYAIHGRTLIDRSWDIFGLTTIGAMIFLPQLDMD